MPETAKPVVPLVDRVTQALHSAMTLTITTSVGPSTLGANGWEPGPDAKIAFTSIDMVTGDIKTHLDPAYVTGDYAAIRDFHLEREKQGAAIVKGNVEALKEIVRLLREIEKK